MTADTVTIRLAHEEDLEGVVDLWMELMEYHATYHPLLQLAEDARLLARQELSKRLKNPYARFFVIVTENQQLLGMMATSYTIHSRTNRRYKTGYIAETIIRETYRGQGLGSRLAEVAKDWFRVLQVDYLEVQVVPYNEGALRFWRGQGFEAITCQMVMTMSENT
jgi:ribosomal protein S18 acetylase RimI-like enzyme